MAANQPCVGSMQKGSCLTLDSEGSYPSSSDYSSDFSLH